MDTERRRNEKDQASEYDNLSPVEVSILNSPGLGKLFNVVLSTQQTFSEQSQERIPAIQDERRTLLQRVEDTNQLYQDLLDKARDPARVTSGDVDPNQLQQLAQEITSSNERISLLDGEETRINTSHALILEIRKLVVQLYEDGVSIPSTIEQRRGEADLQTIQTPEPETELTTGLSGLLEKVPELFNRVIEDTGRDVGKVTGTEDERQKVLEGFQSWKDVFQTETEPESNQVQAYRNSMAIVLRAMKDNPLFAQFGIPNGQETQVDWLGAAKAMWFLTVSELNSAINPKDSKTLPSTQRILALIHRVQFDEYAPAGSFETLAQLIRSVDFSEKNPDLSIAEFMEQQRKTEKVETVIFDANTHNPDTEANPVNEKQDNLKLVITILERINTRTSELKIKNFPKKGIPPSKVTQLTGIKASILDFLSEKGLVKPTGKSQTHPTVYIELDLVKLLVWEQFDDKDNAALLKSELDKITQEIYFEARQLYDAQKD